MVKEAYLKGSYHEAASGKNSLKTICYKIGALVFIGQHQEARLLYGEFASQLSQENLAIARFHLGISYTRTSDYQKARKFFCDNLVSVRKHPLGPIAAFYAYQGISFYRFFFSQHRKSQKYAEKGYANLLKCEFEEPLLMALSLDIQGHNLIQMGKIHLGLTSLKRALKITESHDLTNLNSEIKIALVIYESEYDENLEKQIQRLKKLLKETDNQNDYSRSELVLQIAKLYMLMGRFAESNQFLTDNFEVIYKNENKRKIAKLNTLMAQLMYHRGQLLEALSVVKIAQKNLSEKTDTSLLLPIIGLEMKILSQLGRETKDLELLANRLSSGIDRHINQRIQSRMLSKAWQQNRGEDKMGDLIDQIYHDKQNAIDSIVDKKFLGFVPFVFSIKPGQKALIISRLKNEIFLVSLDGVTHVEASISKIQLEILKCLKNRGTTKEALVEKVWGYQYDPLRHDSLVYTNIARLRKILGQYKEWIVSDENIYHFSTEIQIVVDEFVTPKVEKKNQEELSFSEVEFNHRQLETLKKFKNKPLSVSDYGEQWSVTRMTALRDLKTLCEMGLARKVGKGKATRYFV